MTAALRANSAQRETHRQKRSVSPPLILRIRPLHHGFVSGSLSLLRRINFWTYLRIMGMYRGCARTRGFIQPWWKSCHRSRGPWDRTGPTLWRERARRFPTAKRYLWSIVTLSRRTFCSCVRVFAHRLRLLWVFFYFWMTVWDVRHRAVSARVS